MEIIKKNLSALLPAEYNPRKISDKNLERLKDSIENFGLLDPIVVNKRFNYRVISGHQRLKALQEMGIEETEVIVVDFDEDKEKAANIAMNNQNLQGEWEEEKLAELLKELEEKEMSDLTGFEDKEISELLDTLKEVEEDKFEEPTEPKYKVKRGDMFQLGQHRLMCGDATKREDVEKLMNGEKADMVFCDPPYGMNLNTDFSGMKGIGTGNKFNKVIGDNEDFTPELITSVLDNFRYCKEVFLWGADYYAELIPNRNKGAFIVWDKMSGGEGVNDNYDKMFGSNFELCWSKAKHKRAIARVLWKGIFGLSDEPDKKKYHPTQKPVKLSEWFINKFSETKHLIVDVYGGSGSTLIACEQLDRKCFMMEFDERYVSVILERWEKLTGEKHIKL